MSALSLPADILEKAAAVDIYDVSGEKVKFGTVYADQATVIVFIRHFHCGSCQDYATALSSVRQQALTDARTKIVLIGCGQPQLIPNYRDLTGFTHPIYADPDLSLFRLLDLGSSFKRPGANDPKREYETQGLLATTLRSAWTGPLKNPTHIGKQGPYAQLGGEFILGPGLQCSFAHSMTNTADHVDVKELMQAAGVAYP